MNRRILWIVIAGVATAAALGWLLLRATPDSIPEDLDLPPAVVSPTPTPAPKQRITLLFAGSDGLLHPELRDVPLPQEMAARIRIVVQELLAGPTGNLMSVFPYPAELRAVFVGLDGRAYVDLTGPPEPLGGSQTELMMAYGVVNTVMLNTEVRAVQLLLDGAEQPTISGHLDTSRPLVLNKRFIGRP